MEVYITVTNDVFPFYSCYTAKDTGKDYKVCMGLHFKYNSKYIKRWTKEQYDKLVIERCNLITEDIEMRKALNDRAKELLESL